MPDATPRRILYYCQSLVGIGHLTCSLRIIERLLEHAEVDLIHGGLDAGTPAPRAGFRSLRLPTLLHDEETGGFVDPHAGRDAAAVWPERERVIAGFLRMPYHAVVVEFYPFGRRRFKPEIQALLRAVRERSGPVPVFTSVREVLVPRAVEQERRMVDTVRKHIHTVFVRGDPDVIRLDETFSLAPEIAACLCYTGYISPPPPVGERPARTRQIVVSQGGGDVGRELLEAAIDAAPLMPGHAFVLAAGARTPPAALDALRRRVRSANVEIVPFLADFPRRLMASAASISMGGDNTLLDVLAAGTPGLAYPYQGNVEQAIRIRRFAAKGLLHELGPQDLAPPRLKRRIETALCAPAPAHRLAMDGARVTSERIRHVLAHAPLRSP